jgi:hypothetical protein
VSTTQRDDPMGFVEFDLAGASLSDLRALYAALAIEELNPGDPELLDLLRHVVDRSERDALALERCWHRMSKIVDEESWYDGGFIERHQHTQRLVEVLVRGDLEDMRDACSRSAARLFVALSNRHFWDALHASGYCIDHGHARAKAAAHAQATLEQLRARAIRETAPGTPSTDRA